MILCGVMPMRSARDIYAQCGKRHKYHVRSSDIRIAKPSLKQLLYLMSDSHIGVTVWLQQRSH